MGFFKSAGFKYLKNFIIGIGAAIVMVGALYKIQSWENPAWLPEGLDLITIGLAVEAFLFLLLAIIPPEPDYYWDKLYPGLSSYNGNVAPLTTGVGVAANQAPALNGDVVERQLGGMLTELQTMSSSMSSLKALQEADFSGTADQVKTMSNYYTKLNEAMANLGDSLQDTKQYKDQLAALNKNLGSLNSVYGNVLTAMSNISAPTK